MVNQVDAENFDRAIGRPINVKRVANGYVFDINVGGYDPVTDASTVSAAVRKAGLDNKGTIRLLPRDYLNEYGFDYIEMDRAVDDDMQIGYNKIVENFIKELENGAIQEAEGFDSRVKKEDGSEPISEEMTMSQSPKSQTADFQVLSPNELKDYGLDLESELVISVRQK